MSMLSEKLSSRNIRVGELFRRIFPTGKSETAPERSTDEGSVLDSFRLCFHILKCGCHMFVCFCKKLICCILLYRNLKWRTDFFFDVWSVILQKYLSFLAKESWANYTPLQSYEFPVLYISQALCLLDWRQHPFTRDLLRETGRKLNHSCYSALNASNSHDQKKKAWVRFTVYCHVSVRKEDWLTEKFNRNMTKLYHGIFFFF